MNEASQAKAISIAAIGAVLALAIAAFIFNFDELGIGPGDFFYWGFVVLPVAGLSLFAVFGGIALAFYVLAKS